MIWVVALVIAVEAHAEIEIAAWELSGRVSLEGRYFPKTGIDPSHQSSHTTGIVVEPKLYVEDVEGRSATVVPFFFATTVRTQSAPTGICGKRMLCCTASSGRVNGKCGWARTGVFWGVAESQHLVDIINQIDFLEHPNGEVKLGQPMVHVTWTSDWGTLEFFGLPYHRPAHLPGPGRSPALRGDSWTTSGSNTRARPRSGIRISQPATVTASDLWTSA